METLRELFEKREIIISLHNDNEEPEWSSFLVVQYIIDNQDIFDNFFIKYPLDGIDNEDDLYLYYLSEKIVSLSLTIPHLKNDDDKAIIAKIIGEAEEVLNKISIGLVIKYINQNYKQLLDKRRTNHDLRDRTADIIGQYSSSGISKSVLVYIAENDGYMVIDRFEDFEKAVEKDNELFQKLFPTGHLSEIDGFRYSETLNIWAHIINKQVSSIKSLVHDRINVLYEDIIDYANGVSQANVFQKESIIREFGRFLQRIGSPKANEFAAISKNIQNMLSKEVKENGQSFSYEIPVGEILNQWRKKEPWETRMLMLTCMIKDEGGRRKLDSQLNYRSEKPRYFDFAQSNIPTDNFFTSSHQHWLSLCENVNGAIIAGILKDKEMATDYLNMITTIVDQYTELTDSADEKLQEDIRLLLCMVQLVIQNENADHDVIRSLCYGAAMFICAIIEKVLRIAYMKLTFNDQYIPIEKITLGEMLNIDNPYFSTVFEKDHLNNLAFYLVHIPPERIGRNYRNALAHWSDITIDVLEPFLVDKLLWLLNDVIITLILYFERHQNKDTIDE